jgi:hypothetical protein
MGTWWHWWLAMGFWGWTFSNKPKWGYHGRNIKEINVHSEETTYKWIQMVDTLQKRVEFTFLQTIDSMTLYNYIIYMFLLTDHGPFTGFCWRTVYRPAKCNVFVFPVTSHVLLPFMWPCTWSWWGGVGHVTVRWNLHMTLMLRDEPSLELAHDVDATLQNL